MCAPTRRRRARGQGSFRGPDSMVMVGAVAHVQVTQTAVVQEAFDLGSVRLVGLVLGHRRGAPRAQAACRSGCCVKRPRKVQRKGGASRRFQCEMKAITRTASSAGERKTPCLRTRFCRMENQ